MGGKGPSKLYLPGDAVDTKTRYILVGCGDSGRGISERLKGVLTRDLSTVIVNSQSLDLAELEAVIKSNDVVFLLCGVASTDEVIAAGVIRELCRMNHVPIIGIALMPAAGGYSDFTSRNVSMLREQVPNLIVLDHSRIASSHPEVGEDGAIDLTHHAIGKLITETADLIDTISIFKLEDVWSYRVK